jgi:hypothetical protein
MNQLIMHPVSIFGMMYVYHDNIYQREKTGCSSRLYLITYNHTTVLCMAVQNGAAKKREDS